jgi:hypothetical protein
MSELINAWRNWQASGARGVLPGDEALLDRPDLTCNHRSWEDFVASDEWVTKSKRLHLGLTPTPYVGSLETACIFVLLLNPGFGPLNYFAEYQAPDGQAMHLDCIAQNDANARRGFYLLTPESSWRGGFRYWHGKLSRVANALAQETGLSLVGAFDRIRRGLAVIELVPYHSAVFGMPRSAMDGLRSVQLAQQFVHEYVMPKMQRGDATVVVTRKAKLWGVEPTERVIVYEGSETRGAHLGPTTRGGQAILRALLEGG